MSYYGDPNAYNLGGYGGYPANCVVTPPPPQPIPVPLPVPQPQPIHHQQLPYCPPTYHHQPQQQQHHHHQPQHHHAQIHHVHQPSHHHHQSHRHQHHQQHHHHQPSYQAVEQLECVEVGGRSGGSSHHYSSQSNNVVANYNTAEIATTPVNVAPPTPTVISSGPSLSYESNISTSYQQQQQQQQQQVTSYQQQQQTQQQQSYSVIGGGQSTTSASTTTAGLSQVEAAILRSNAPIDIHETEEITVNGQRGIWANKQEVVNWRGPVPVSQYAINEDSNPEIITKRSNQHVEYIQELAIRYLRPPTPPAPGEIIITQEVNSLTPPAPPLIIRQQPPRPTTPEPLVIREAPPQPPCQVGRKVITISGKRLPPPPRKVIIERLAPLPSKPQSVIVERWLPYSQPKRRVIFQRSNERDAVIVKPRNVVIQWEAPRVNIKKEIKYLGVIRANPVEYVQRYGTTLKTSRELPDFVLDIKTPEGIVLAADYKYNTVHELEGEVAALKLVDLDREGLSEYRSYLQRLGISYVGASNVNQYASQLNTSQVNFGSQQQQQQQQHHHHQQQQSYSAETIVNATTINTEAYTLSGHQQQQQHSTNYDIGAAVTPTHQQQANIDYSQYCGSGSYENSYGYGAAPTGLAEHHLAVQQESSNGEQQQQQPSPTPNAREVIGEMFAALDRDRAGRVSYEEAERLLLRLNSRLNRSYGEHDVRAFFQALDVNRDGSIEVKEIRAAFERSV